MPPQPSLYPRTPAGIPENLAEPSAAYRRQTRLVFISLMSFLFIYVSLIIALVVLAFWILLTGSSSSYGWSMMDPVPIHHPIGQPPRMPQQPNQPPGAGQRLQPQNPRQPFQPPGVTPRSPAPFQPPPTWQPGPAEDDLSVRSRRRSSASSGEGGMTVLKVVAALFLFAIVVYLVKGLFKFHEPEKRFEMEIDLDKNPQLNDFINRLVKDTQSEHPRRVLISPEVNAAVVYNTSVRHLFSPPPKDLLIGLGLVNALTISEFKAVLAHEFGHFSQSSLKLGAYVYIANRIVGDIVFGRDFFDIWVDRLPYSDTILAFFGWALYSATWTLRKGLVLIFKSINLANARLMREMEFHADMVAVSVSGSDALIHALYKMDFANATLDCAIEELNHAAQQKVYTKDLFYHQRRAFDHLRYKKNKPDWGEPPPLPPDPAKRTRLFKPEDEDELPDQWASHPSNYERETNAKRTYFRSPSDQRSAWLLFGESSELREKITAKFNRLAYKVKDKAKALPPSEVHQFIEAERTETCHDPQYHGFYDGRFIEPGSLENATRAPRWSNQEVIDRLNHCYPPDLHKKTAKLEKLELEEAKLIQRMMEDPALRQGSFLFRGKKHVSGDEKRLLKKVRKETERIHEQFQQYDEAICGIHFQLARSLGDAWVKDLTCRYRFQMLAQSIAKMLMRHHGHVLEALNDLGEKTVVTEEEIEVVQRVLRAAHHSLKDCLKEARDATIPPLANLPEGMPLSEFLVDKKLLADFDSIHDRGQLSGRWIVKLLEQFNSVLERAKRLHFKSLGALLFLQEQLRMEWTQSTAPQPSTR